VTASTAVLDFKQELLTPLWTHDVRVVKKVLASLLSFLSFFTHGDWRLRELNIFTFSMKNFTISGFFMDLYM
jgi:hypothetical protein